MESDEEDVAESVSGTQQGTNSDASEGRSRQEFDFTLPPTHQYLQLRAGDETVYDTKREEDNTVLTISIMELPIVLFPTQLLPFHTDMPHLVEQLKEAARTNAFIALKPSILGNTSQIATLVQISSLHETEHGVSVQAIGRQRCKILNRHSAVNGMPFGDVLVLEERELKNFIRIVPPLSFSKLPLPKYIGYFAAITAHQKFAIEKSLTKSLIDELKQWLSKWHLPDKVTVVLREGPTSFSYWVAANIPIDMESRLLLLEEPCTDKRLASECVLIREIDTIVCKNCGNTLCHMDDMISVSVEGSSAHYVNPGGYVHDLFTVSRVKSSTAHGTASSEYSWFPGYKWTIHECARCYQHIGWRFTSTSLEPASFFGLTRSSIRPVKSNSPSRGQVARIEQLAIV